VPPVLRSSLTHVDQAEVSVVHRASGIDVESDAVVNDAKRHRAILVSELGAHLRRARVPRRVEEGLLPDSEKLFLDGSLASLRPTGDAEDEARRRLLRDAVARVLDRPSQAAAFERR
jgi:hypothetical protein